MSKNVIVTGFVVGNDESRKLDAQLPCDVSKVTWTPSDYLDDPFSPTPIIQCPKSDIVYCVAYGVRGHHEEFLKSIHIRVQAAPNVTLLLLPNKCLKEPPLQFLNSPPPLKKGLPLHFCVSGTGLSETSKLVWWVNSKENVLSKREVECKNNTYIVHIPRKFDDTKKSNLYYTNVNDVPEVRFVVGLTIRNEGLVRTFCKHITDNDLFQQGYVKFPVKN